MDLKKQIANKLKKERIKAGFSSSEKFANHIDIGRSQYQEYESGKVKIQVETLYKIVKAMSLTLSEFFEGIE